MHLRKSIFFGIFWMDVPVKYRHQLLLFCRTKYHWNNITNLKKLHFMDDELMFLFFSSQVYDAHNLQYSLEIGRNMTPTTQLPSLNEVTTKLLNDGITMDAGYTVTPKPANTQLDDIFLAVKTTQTNHAKRLSIIAKTWFQIAREQVIIHVTVIGNILILSLDPIKLIS